MKARELKEKEMENVIGGSISASFINYFARILDTLFDIGKETGSAIRRLTSGNYCSVN